MMDDGSIHSDDRVGWPASGSSIHRSHEMTLLALHIDSARGARYLHPPTSATTPSRRTSDGPKIRARSTSRLVRGANSGHSPSAG